MTSIGETLRRERLRRNLDFDQISHELKISPRLLEAIEAEEFDKLPGAIFAKSFVRQYAHYLGLDEDEMASEVQKLLTPSEPELTRFAEPEASVAPIQVPKVEEWETVGDRRGFSWASPLPALALFVVAMLACSGIYAWYQRTRHPAAAPQNTTAAVQAQTPPQPAPVAAPPQAAPPQSSEAAPATPSAQPEQPQQQTEAAKTATPAITPVPNPTGAMHIQITAEEPAWVLVRADGKYLFSGTLDTNQTRTVDAVKNLELRLGNAGGVSVQFNGTSIGAIGPKGQVRTVQFTPGGFQIVAAPKSPPADPLG